MRDFVYDSSNRCIRVSSQSKFSEKLFDPEPVASFGNLSIPLREHEF
jgi:hypothetical protein